MLTTLITAFVALCKAAAWPLAIIYILAKYKADLVLLLPRVRKAGPAGIEFDPAAQQQSLPSSDLTGDIPRPLPGFTRSEAMTDFERKFRVALAAVDEKDRLDVTILQVAQARLAMHFERVYRMIFGTQIRLLRLLNEHNGRLPSLNVRFFFEKETAPFAEMFNSFGYDNWMTFMLNEDLVRLDQDITTLSPIGKDFLLYLLQKGYPEDRSY